MVALLGVRTQELLYEEFGNITADILSVWEKAECSEEIANQSQRLFKFKIINFEFSYIFDVTHWKIWIKIKIHWEWLATSISDLFIEIFIETSILSGAHSEMCNHPIWKPW